MQILSFQNFFRKYAPSDNGPYGISAEVMDTYVKSCGKFTNDCFPLIHLNGGRWAILQLPQSHTFRIC